MKMTEKLSPEVLGDVRQNVGADNEDDESFDDVINKMSRDDVLKAFLEWNGIIGYLFQIKQAIEDIYSIDLVNVDKEGIDNGKKYNSI